MTEKPFRGRLDRDSITLNRGQQETITVTDLVIPQGTKIGMELLLSLVVRKDLDPVYNDPSDKIEVQATVVFKVTDEMSEDNTEPWIKIEYGAESEDETCTNGPGEPGCDLEYWWVKFHIQDEDSGLHLIDVKPGDKETYPNQLFYYR